jgi:hypothetical protein
MFKINVFPELYVGVDGGRGQPYFHLHFKIKYVKVVELLMLATRYP